MSSPLISPGPPADYIPTIINHNYQYPSPPRTDATPDSSSTTPKPHTGTPKRIILALDGTWQDSDANTGSDYSNITRLCRSILPTGLTSHPTTPQPIKQTTFYQDGVGTPSLRYFLLEKVLGGVFGTGLDANVIEAYNFIANNYEAGDELFFFGFSRGAYTARAVAGLIEEIGILMKGKDRGLDYFTFIYDTFRKFDPYHTKLTLEKQKEAFNQFLQAGKFDRHINVPIKCVAVFDTVGALGIPEKGWLRVPLWFLQRGFLDVNRGLRFHNTDLGRGVQNALQVLALDEMRSSFGPAVWHLKQTPPGQTQADYPAQNLMQIWFPGSHTDIGGGYHQNFWTKAKEHPEWSDITLAWMLDQLAPAGTQQQLITLDREYLKLELETRRNKRLEKIRNGRPPGSESSYARKVFDSLKSITGITGKEVRTPGLYVGVGKDGGGQTGECFHPAVRARWRDKVVGYKPEAIVKGGWDVEEVVDAEGRRWVWRKKGANGEVVLEMGEGEERGPGEWEGLLLSREDWEVMYGRPGPSEEREEGGAVSKVVGVVGMQEVLA